MLLACTDYSSTLKMYAFLSLEISVKFYQNIQPHIPDNSGLLFKVIAMTTSNFTYKTVCTIEKENNGQSKSSDATLKFLPDTT
jgi:hypothetical protein